MEIIEIIQNKTLKDKGCTYSLELRKMIEPGEPFYIVSLHKELEEIIPLDEFGYSKIQMFMLKNSEQVNMSGRAIGTWIHESSVYIDVVTLIDKRSVSSIDELRELAPDQLAAWDAETNSEISLKN